MSLFNVTTTPCPWIGGKKPKVPAKQVIIAGTRTFDEPNLLFEKMDVYTFFFDLVEVHIGGYGERFWDDSLDEYRNRGADWWGNVWAEQRWFTKHIHHADWHAHNKAAGPMRNREMAEAVAPHGYLIAFWNGESKGTKSMIDEFLKFNKESRLRVVYYAKRRK